MVSLAIDRLAVTSTTDVDLAGTWRSETEETESCDDREDDQHDEDRGPTTRRSEMDEWEEELEADIELERRELGQSPPEDHEDWADD